MAQSNHQISLPADFKLEMNATVKGPMAYGVYNIDSQWWVDAGITRSFMDNKLNVTLRATDIFKTMDMNVDAYYGGNYFNLKQYFGQQAISLNVLYSFSNGNKAEREVRNDSLDVMNRAGGN